MPDRLFDAALAINGITKIVVTLGIGGPQGDCLVFGVDHRPADALTGALIDEGFKVRNRYLEPLRVLDNRTIVAGSG